MRIKELILVGVLLGLMMGSAAIYVYPSTTSYSIVNYGDEGLSMLAHVFNASISLEADVLRDVEALKTAYLIIRSKSVASNEIEEITNFLSRGGYVVASGTPEFIGSLIKHLNITMKVEGGTICDMVYNYGDRFHPLGFSSYCNTIVVPYVPYHVVTEGLVVLSYTSNFSYVDVDEDGYMDINEPLGPFPLAVLADVGEGRLVFISSPHIFTNKLLNLNREFIQCILGGRNLIIDQADVRQSFLEYFRLLVSTRGVTYYMFVFLAIVLSLVIYYVFR
ncbi:MAG: DUF4350 domain-containing protein [Zestosphaera sp.]